MQIRSGFIQGKMTAGLLLFVACLTATSCTSIKELEYKDYKNLKLEKLSFSKVSMSVDLTFYNPNSFGVELKSSDLDIYLNDNFLGHSSQQFQIKVPRKNSFTLPLNIDLDSKNLLKNSINSLFNKEVDLRCSGKITVGKAKLYKTMPFEYKTRQKFSLF